MSVIFLNKVEEKKSAFFRAAGSWKNVDTETLKKQIYDKRNNKLATENTEFTEIFK
ncbi:MAG: hypothetical protein V1872_12475 [bacterium]